MVANSAKGGRPKKRYSREQLDFALELLGREHLSSRIVARLMEKFAGLGRAKAYKLVNEARGELRAQLAGEGFHPAALLWGAYLRLIFRDDVRDEVRIQALNGAVKLIGAGALLEVLRDDGDATKLLEQIAARQAARLGATAKTPNEEHDNGT
jgi:hypothetical protein